jgi:hypothetical protein
MTAGFLVAGVPCIPKVVKSLPFYDHIRNKLHTKVRSNDKQSRRGLPSWYKPERRAPSDSLDITGTDESEIEPFQPAVYVQTPATRVHREL